jgi:hypothetical protein
MRPSVPDVHITDPLDADLAAYRALAPQAVVGLIFGLLAPLAMIDPLLWVLPAVGTVVSFWGLRRIWNCGGELLGRKLAWAGLVLSLLFLAAAPADLFTYRRMIGNEARQFSALWFRCLARQEPQKAWQLHLSPQIRQPLDDRLWQFYRNSARQRNNLQAFVKLPLTRTLLALGPNAEARFYQTAGVGRDDDNDDVVDQYYAVTYEEQGERKSFFVLVRMTRYDLGKGQAGWSIVQTEGGVRPKGW